MGERDPKLAAAIAALAGDDPALRALYEREADAYEDRVRRVREESAAGTSRRAEELSDEEWHRRKDELLPPVVIDDVTRAARERSPEALRAALTAELVSIQDWLLQDFRNTLGLMEPYVDCARRLGHDPRELFGPVAALLPPEMAHTVMEAARRDGSAHSFVVVDDPDGPLYLRREGP